MGEKEEGLVMCKGHSPHAANVGMSAQTSLPAASPALRDPDCPHPRRGPIQTAPIHAGAVSEAGVASPACIAQPVLPLAHCSCPVRTAPPNTRGCGWVALRLSRPSPDGWQPPYRPVGAWGSSWQAWTEGSVMFCPNGAQRHTPQSNKYIFTIKHNV